jgi:Cu+-exporting ATPase
MNNDLNNIFLIIGLSKKINRNIKFNLFWAFLYNAIFIPVATGVFASLNFYLEPKWCALLMVVSSVTVCLNSLFLLRYNNKKAQRKLISTFSIKNR